MSALLGGLLDVSAGVGLTLATQKVSAALRIWHLSKSITAIPEAIPGAYRIRVCNSGKYSIEQAIGYISLKIDPERDLVDGEDSAFIGVHHKKELDDDRLCWSIATADPHPYAIDIYRGEEQALDLVCFHDDKIEIPSEQGWYDPKRKTRSRVFLRKNRYEGDFVLLQRILCAGAGSS